MKGVSKDMIASAIDKILSIAQPVIARSTTSNRAYSTQKLYPIDEELRAEPLQVRNLSSIVKYAKDFKESWKEIPLLVHVVSPLQVVLTTALDSDRMREDLMVANADIPSIPFGSFMENDRMLIIVQSMFVDDKDTDKAIVLKFAGTVTSGSVKAYDDDGVTQKATIKQGVASKAEAIVPSPCSLRPYRTFTEVEQPKSMFIFRMREGRGDGVESALYEADGGAWKNEAMNNIRKYLEKELEGTDITVIS